MKTWQEVAVILGMKGPNFSTEGRILFSLTDRNGIGTVWITGEAEGPDNFIARIQANSRYQFLKRQAAETSDSDPTLTDLTPTTAPEAPAPGLIPDHFNPPDVVPPSGEIDGPGGDLSGDQTFIPLPPITEIFTRFFDPPRRPVPPGLDVQPAPDIGSLARQIPKEVWVVGGVLLALFILK